MSIVSAQQFAAFLATDYQVDAPDGTFVLQVGRYSASLRQLHDQFGASSSAYLTAWNPLGEIVPAEVNAGNQLALQRDLALLAATVIPGEGRARDGSWAEQSLLAVGLAREQAVVLGNRYRQLAIVFAGVDAVPELVVLR